MKLSIADWVVIAAYLLLTLIQGLYFRRQSSRSTADYFVSGRRAAWWLIGTSMVATTFAADTPLVVTGLVYRNGIAGNWIWWSMLPAGMMTVFLFARLWVRAGLLTDVEFAELRYAGKPAAFLRGFRAIYLGLLVNCVILGWVTKAMTTIVGVVLGINERTALALTTAHFYTPSGRLIQRDYSNESYFDYYNVRSDNLRNPQDVKMTDSGRTVYGGGGITPDETYKSEPMDRLQSQLYRNGLFSFTRTYFVSHSSHLAAGWIPDEPVLAELHDYLLKNSYKFTEKEWATDQDWIKRYLTREMYVWAFNKDESDRVFAQMDPEVAQAVEALPKAATLAENARKIVGQRMAPRKPGH